MELNESKGSLEDVFFSVFLHGCDLEVGVIKLKASGSELRGHKDGGARYIKQASASKQLFGLSSVDDGDFKQKLIFCAGCQSPVFERAAVQL